MRSTLVGEEKRSRHPCRETRVFEQGCERPLTGFISMSLGSFPVGKNCIRAVTSLGPYIRDICNGPDCHIKIRTNPLLADDKVLVGDNVVPVCGCIQGGGKPTKPVSRDDDGCTNAKTSRLSIRDQWHYQMWRLDLRTVVVTQRKICAFFVV